MRARRWTALIVAAAWLGCTSSDKPAHEDAADTGVGAPSVRGMLGLCDAYGFESPSVEDLTYGQEPWIELAGAVGATIVRPHRSQGHVFSFNAVVDSAGAHDFSLTDVVVQTTQAAELDLLVTLYPHADLSVEASHSGEVIAMELPEDVGGYEAFVGALVERYDGDGLDDMPGLTRPVAAWEAGNEPGCPAGDAGCIDEQFELLWRTADAIHGADPAAMVLPAGARPVFGDRARDDAGDWMVGDAAELWRGLFERGASEHIDAMGFHLEGGATAVHVDDALAFWTETSGGMPLWITETGVFAPDGSTTAADPASWTEDHVTSAFSGGAEGVFWCSWELLHEHPELIEVLAALSDD